MRAPEREQSRPVRTLAEVADAWLAISGERVRRVTIANVLNAAHAKLTAALESERAA